MMIRKLFMATYESNSSSSFQFENEIHVIFYFFSSIINYFDNIIGNHIIPKIKRTKFHRSKLKKKKKN